MIRTDDVMKILKVVGIGGSIAAGAHIAGNSVKSFNAEEMFMKPVKSIVETISPGSDEPTITSDKIIIPKEKLGSNTEDILKKYYKDTKKEELAKITPKKGG